MLIMTRQIRLERLVGMDVREVEFNFCTGRYANCLASAEELRAHWTEYSNSLPRRED